MRKQMIIPALMKITMIRIEKVVGKEETLIITKSCVLPFFISRD